MVLCAGIAHAQVKDYTFTKENGLLTFLDDMQGVTITNHTVMDDFVTPSKISIPFPFKFNGVLQDSLGIGENGFIWFGPAGDDIMSSVFTPISDNHPATVTGIVAALGMDMHPHLNTGLTTTIKTGVSGTAPMREMIIEWRNTSSYNSLSDTLGEDTISFQIKLYEFMNRVEVAYGQFRMNPNAGDVAQIGLRGNNSNDYNNRMTDAVNKWPETSKGIDVTSGCLIDAQVHPSFGTLLVWTKDNQNPPPPTSTPEFANNAQVRAYPNPTTGKMFFESANPTAQNIVITNSIGQQILATQFAGSNAQINMQGQNSGLYFYHITNAEGQPVAGGKFVLN